MEITLTAIERITPYARNARKIPQQAIDKVAASIQEFGWRQPIVIDGEGVIICGHTRWLAAQKLGLAKIPVHTASNLTPAQVRAYRLMDNRSHQETDWDFELLTTELLELRDLDRHASRQRLESGSEEECISDTSQSPAGWPRGIASSARPGTQCGRKRSRRLRYPGNSG